MSGHLAEKPWQTTIVVTQSKLLSAIKPGKAGRNDAWKQFVEAYVPVIARYARQAGATPSDVDDVIGEVVLAFCRRVEDGWEYERKNLCGRFRAYLRTITVRATRRARLKAGRMASLPEDVEGPLTAEDEQAVDSAERQVIFEESLAAVREQTSPKQFDAWYQRAMRGAAAKDVARDLDLSIDAVNQYHSRVNKKLREAVARRLEALVNEKN